MKKSIQVLAVLGLLSTTACVSPQYKDRMNSPQDYATYVQTKVDSFPRVDLKSANETESFREGTHRSGSVLPKNDFYNVSMVASVYAQPKGEAVQFTIDVYTEVSFNFVIRAVALNGEIRPGTTREELDVKCESYGCRQHQRLFLSVWKSELAKTPGTLQVTTLDHCGTVHTVVVPEVAARGLLLAGGR